MDAFAGVTFGQLRLLLLTPAVIVVVLWLLQRERLRRTRANRFVSERLRGVDLWRSFRPAALAIFLLASLVALAAPRLGFTKRSIEALSRNRVFVLDISNSMDARDIAPSRLAASKALMQRILEKSDGRVGLIVFERRSEIVAPLTTDAAAISTLVDSIHSGETAEAGSDIGEAVRRALATASSTAAEAIDIVVLSDGEDQGSSIDLAIAEARRVDVKVHSILVGMPGEVPIPAEKGNLTDENGRLITTMADPSKLQRLSSETGGIFLANPFSGDGIERLERIASNVDRSGNRREVQIPQERYQWPLSIAVAAFFIAGFLNRGAE